MGFLKSFLGAMVANEINEKKKAEREGINNTGKLLKLRREFIDYLIEINCRNADYEDVVSDEVIDKNRVSSYDIWQTEEFNSKYKKLLKEYMSYGGDPIYIRELNKMELYIQIVKRLKEYGWLDKQKHYVEFADDMYWLDKDWEEEKERRNWLSLVFSLPSNEIREIVKKDNPAFIPYHDHIVGNSIEVEDAYFGTTFYDNDSILFDARLSIKLSDKYIIFYSNIYEEDENGNLSYMHNEMYYKSTIENTTVEIIGTSFTEKLAAVIINDVYVVFAMDRLEQVQRFYNEHNEKIQKENRIACENINSLSGIEFENVCKRLLEQMGFSVETTKASGDGGIDLIGFSSEPLFSGKYIIQCKRYTGSVGEPIIRDLYGVVTSERANKGILMTTGYFTKQARAFAEGKPIELIDGLKLKELMDQSINCNGYNSSSNNRNYMNNVQSIYDNNSSQNSKESMLRKTTVEPALDRNFTRNKSVNLVLGEGTIGAENFSKWEKKYLQSSRDITARCKLIETLHSSILGKISDNSIQTPDFCEAAEQLSVLIKPLIEPSMIGNTREENYRYYMSCIIDGECNFWTGKIFEALEKWDRVADTWSELSGDIIFCSNIQGELILSVISCLRIMRFEDIAEKYGQYWKARLTADNTIHEMDNNMFALFGNNMTIERIDAIPFEYIAPGIYLDTMSENSQLMCEGGISFSTLESWIISSENDTLKIVEKESNIGKEILHNFTSYVSTCSTTIHEYFNEKYGDRFC